MATIRQRIPAFFSGIEPDIVEFNTQDELLEIDFVRNFSIDRRFGEETPDEYFHQYSLSGNNLMAEVNGGKSWFVIGTLDDTSMLNLPEWIPKNEEDS